MKKIALTLACALAMGAALPASAIEVLSNDSAVMRQGALVPALATAPGSNLLPSAQLSELPEPEVFAMMLLGLVLIGYRASRESDETFK
ncbi:MAG: hypothetical protein V4633_20840 [Pseudomonadota bacterium]